MPWLLLLCLIITKVAADGEVSLIRKDGENRNRAVCLGHEVTYTCQINHTTSITWRVRPPFSSVTETTSFFADDTPDTAKRSATYFATLTTIDCDGRFCNLTSNLSLNATASLNGTHIRCVGTQRNLQDPVTEETTLTVLGGREEDDGLDTDENDGDSTPPDDSSGTAVLCGGVLLIMCMNIIFMGVVNYIYV